MEFIDRTGHIFSLSSYRTYPTGYEYEINDYIFWVDNEYSYKLSVGNYYFKPIRIAVPHIEDASQYQITVEMDSEVFALIGSARVDEAIKSLKDYNDYIELDDKVFTQHLTSGYGTKGDDDYMPSDFNIISGVPTIKTDSDDAKYDIITFYVIAYTNEAATWDSNILIYINNGIEEAFCPITVGATFVNECEELIINGFNYGIYLPKDILKAVYECSFYNQVEDTDLYNNKIKEYLMNLSNIKGECGNYRSVIDSINWFGYNNRLTISKLLETDNDFIYQYVQDNFNVDEDILDAFYSFKHSAYITLQLPANRDTKYHTPIDWDNEFWGEANPLLEDLFDRTELITYDEPNEDATFDAYWAKPYYDYMFAELGLKLTAMKYYLERYFLPIHIRVHSASVAFKTYTDNIKMLVGYRNAICEAAMLINESKSKVIFPTIGHQYIETNPHFVDENFNEFANSRDIALAEQGYTMYYSHTPVIAIPLKFVTTNEAQEIIDDTDTIYNIIIKLFKDDKCVFSKSTSFIQNSSLGEYKNFIINPKLFSEGAFDITEWLGNHNYTLSVYLNGKWYNYEFDIQMPVLNINMGTLEYKYDDRFSQFEQDLLSLYMHQSELVTLNDTGYIRKIKALKENSILRYVDTLNLSKNPKYYNTIILAEIDEEVKSMLTTDDANFEYIFDIDKYNEQFDVFLMYNGTTNEDKINDNAYFVFISKETDIQDCPFKIGETVRVINGRDDGQTIEVTVTNIDTRILINRLDINFNNGVNQFNKDDIIVARIANEDALSFNADSQSKWSIKGLTSLITKFSDVTSNSNVAVISYGSVSDGFEPGYYDITVNYNIDDIEDNAIIKTKRFLIK